MRSNFFQYLNWILRKNKNQPEIPKNCGFIVNRWLSMTNESIVKIVNLTTNRWNKNNVTFDDEMQSILYRSIIPKHLKNIEYIKKPSKEDDIDDKEIDNLCYSMEISRKELENYHIMLEELNLQPK